MAKKAKKQEFPNELYVYMDDFDDELIPVASEEVECMVDRDNPVRPVGIYQLVKVVTVKRSVEVTVEE